MFRKIEDFEKAMEGEIKFTHSVLSALTDESLKQSVNNDHRNIGRIAWHICETYGEMMSQIGLQLEQVKAPIPDSANAIADKYQELAGSALKQIKENWNDESLVKEDELYGEKWMRGNTLMIFIKHEIHHRGQITVLMRQAGVKVPDIYGPAYEGWANYEMQPPEI